MSVAADPLLVISPHLDDAVLSIGGLLATEARRRDVVVVTVFAGSAPPGPRSEFARQLHADWGLGDDPTPGRRAEDLRALAAVGATAVQLPFPDAIYRRDPQGALRYPDWDAVASGRPEEEDSLIDDIAGALGTTIDRYRPGRVLGPLACGGHVDHVVTRRALERVPRATTAGPAEQAGPARAETWWYEDLPYTARTGAPPAALVTGLGAVVVDLDDDAWRAKLLAVHEYGSQLETVFGEPVMDARGTPFSSPDAVLAMHARRISRHPDRHAERLWRPDRPALGA